MAHVKTIAVAMKMVLYRLATVNHRETLWFFIFQQKGMLQR